MEQPKVRMLQRRDLGSPDAAIGKLPHQTRMFFFPLRPHGRVFENTPRDQLLVVVGTRKRRLYAISGYAHESRVTDGMAEHSSLLNPRFWQMRGSPTAAICRQRCEPRSHPRPWLSSRLTKASPRLSELYPITLNINHM